MKKRLAAVICTLLCELCLFSACGGGNGGLFVFLSVRLKGNGDGSISVVAQNEFGLGSAELPVTLQLYRSDGYRTDTRSMEKIKWAHERLGVSQKCEFLYQIKSAGYYCARIEYILNGETKYIQSDTVYYDINGKRISSP